MAPDPKAHAPDFDYSVSDKVRQLERVFAYEEHTATKLWVENQKLKASLTHFKKLHLADQQTIAQLRAQLEEDA